MSISRNIKKHGLIGSLLNRLAKRGDSKSRTRAQKTRKLAIDQLEERQLLSLTVATTENVLVNTSWQDIRGDIAADSNKSGDLVVAWTAADRLANPDYDATDPESSVYLLDDDGNYVEDYNVYARYLTDEVQIITIPQECVPGATLSDGSTVQSASFELLYNAFETQRLSIFNSTFTHNEGDTYTTTNSQSVFYLGLYAEGELTWVLYRYDSNLLPGDNAANLQEVIRAIPGNEYKDVEVTAYSESDFDITFYGDNWSGYDLTDVRVSNDYYSDVTALIDKVSALTFDVSELQGCTPFQKLVLKDLFGNNYSTNISSIIKSQGRRSVVKTLQTARDTLVDNLTSANVTTVKEVRTITTTNNKGQVQGIVVSNDPYKTAQNIQNAFNNLSQQATLYAPITRGYEYSERDHVYNQVAPPVHANFSNESYGSMQTAIQPLEVVVTPYDDTGTKFKVTFTGASGLVDQDPLVVSAATYSTKMGKNYVYNDVIVQNSKTGAYQYVGTESDDYTVDSATTTLKQSSNVFRVNAPEVADFVIDEDGDVVTDRYSAVMLNGTGRMAQVKPDVAIAEDGTFVVVWQNENADALDRYNATDIMARRFAVQGYIEESDPYYDTLTFYDNGATDGKLGYNPPDTAYSTDFVADPYALEPESTTKVQCVRPLADAFVVNASLNGQQIDPSISSDLDGNFIVAWTYLAQDNSYFGGIYGRQFNNEAQPITGDITFASSQVSTNHYGPAHVGMGEGGYAVVMWNDGSDLYHSTLEPQSSVFIVDAELVANNAYGGSVDFDYNSRYGIAYTVKVASDASGTTTYPATDVVLAVYEIASAGEDSEATTAFDEVVTVTTDSSSGSTTDSDDATTAVDLYVDRHIASTAYTASQIMTTNWEEINDQGRPSVGLDADGDVFLAFQGFGPDIHMEDAALNDAVTLSLLPATNIQIEWSDFEDNNLAYENKQFYRGQKYSYESKNEDLIKYIKLALGWGYDEDGALINDGSQTPVYILREYDCIDVDSYIKFFMAVAQKEKATDEQLMRLTAVLETLLSPLRNNGNDVSFINYAQTAYAGSSSGSSSSSSDSSTSTDTSASTTSSATTLSPLVSYGTVSGYRNGSNACFYIALPAYYVSAATVSIDVGRLTDRDSLLARPATVETISLDLGSYYTNGIPNIVNMGAGVQEALNGLAICGDYDNCFVVRYVSSDEYEFYKDTYGEIGVDVEAFQYTYSYTENNVTYTGQRTVEDYVILQVTAQNALHDTPLYLSWNYDNSTLNLVDQSVEGLNYVFHESFAVERYGSTGTAQTNPHVSETSNGDVAVVWGMQTQANAQKRSDVFPAIGNTLDTQFSHIYMRSFVESTDTAGPIVTNFSLPNGTKVDNGQTVTSAVKDFVVAFNENMITMDGTSYNNQHAVDNPANWHILKDGVIVPGAIASISFGMNESETLARNTVDENDDPVDSINSGALAYGTNRWEAVVRLADGFELNDGNYTVVCTAMTQDTARNGLYAQGYASDGSASGYAGHDWECSFNVIPLNEALAFEYSSQFPYNNSYIPVEKVHGEETIGDASTDPVLQAEQSGETIRQVTRSSILEDTSDYGPNTATTVASDSNGNTVVVWVETTGDLDENGFGTQTKTVYARTYRALYVKNAEGNREQIIDMEHSAGTPIVVQQSTNTYENFALVAGQDPRQASVAMDDNGNFAVVWDMIMDGEKNGERDVFIKKYAFNGGQLAVNGNSTSPTRVNVETDNDQQYAAVAMDSDGDIVVVWESYEQDGSGWGIFGRRFLANGYSYGYANTVQRLQFVDSVNVQGDQLKLSLDLELLQNGKSVFKTIKTTVDLSVEMQTNAKNIKAALLDAIGNVDPTITESDLAVGVSSAGEISVEFKGSYTARYINLLEATTNRSDLRVNVEMVQTGVEGVEFAVNQTTENNQRFASIGMQADGAFVVSWTSWGQDSDSNVESNIYARQFISNHLISSSVVNVDETPLFAQKAGAAQVISNDDIEDHELYPGDGYESVCAVTYGDLLTGDWEGLGTGSLLKSRRHILTAAHVVCDENGAVLDIEDTPMFANFETENGLISIRVASIAVHPTYAGDAFGNEVDLAVLTLEYQAPSSLEGYDLYTGTDELGQTTTFVGYGRYGDTDDDLTTSDNLPAGVKHIGWNVFELTGAECEYVGNPNTLLFDFDDGTYANDFIGGTYGIRNLGLGDEYEAGTAPGDSGGPAFINGKIAGTLTGVTSSDYANLEEGNVAPGFGVIVEVRISSYVDWINSVVMSGLGDEFLVNTDYQVTVTEDDDSSSTSSDDETVVIDTSTWQKGNQIWSNVAMGADGNFVITWTGYNQDGNGDAQTGASNNGLGGVFMRGFYTEDTYGYAIGSKVFQVNDYTANDQVHSSVAMTPNGKITVVYESYQDPSNDVNSDVADNFGIYARRYEFTTEKATQYAVGTDNSVTAVVVTSRDIVEDGESFQVSRFGFFEDEYNELGIAVADYDQLGGSVAVDANGDMVFVWSDLSNPYDNVESVVCMRWLTLPNDTTPPFVTRANAAYTNTEDAGRYLVSLINNVVTFPSGHGPESLVYAFSEYMYTGQMNLAVKNDVFDYDDVFGYRGNKNLENKTVKSVIDYNDWTLTLNGKNVTSSFVYDIVYGYNASTETVLKNYLASIGAEEGTYLESFVPDEYATNNYELAILFKQPLPDGTYILTLSDKVADASAKNTLDGDYDGKSDGSFSVRWIIGAGNNTEDGIVPDKDSDAFTGLYGGEGEPVCVSNSDGFVIVTERQVMYELDGTTTSGSGTNNNNNNNNNNNGDVFGYYETVIIDGTEYRIESDIIMRRFNADGSPKGVETRVNTYSEGNQIDPDVAMTEGGSIVVAWIGESEDALNGVSARFYPGGQAQSKQIQVAGTKGMRCWDCDVSINEETGLVLITWVQGSKDNDTKADEMYGRFYDLNGQAKSTAFKILSQVDGKSVQNFDVASMTVNGEIRYYCTWEMYEEATRSFNIYQKVITASASGKNFFATGSAITRVNDTTAYGQYAPQIAANDDTDEYYIVWVSDHIQGNGGDIYVKKFDSNGNALPFMGTTDESRVNVWTKHVQGAPTVACNSDGVAFAWESYDAEEYNYNNSVDIKQNQHDYGISCRVFNAEGYPVYVMGDILREENGVEVLQTFNYGDQLPLNEGEFIINSTTSGNQFHPSVAVFDWVNGVPKFVVAWAGPNLNAAEEIEEDDSSSNSGSSSGDNNNNNNNNNNNTQDDTAYVGPYSVFYKLVSVAGGTTTDSTVTSTTLRYTNEPGVQKNGFYLPFGGAVEQPLVASATVNANTNVMSVSGTDGDDVVLVKTNAKGALVSLTVNGESIAIPSGVSTVYFDGGAGADSIEYVGGGADALYVDAAAKKATVSGAQLFYATNIETFASTGSVADLAIAANSANALVEFAPKSATVTATGFRFTASNVAKATATGGGQATVVLTGSEADEAFVATNTFATFVGAGFDFTANSFGVVRASSGGGADSATLEDLQRLVATDSAAVGATSKSSIAAFGFASLDAIGSGASTASIYGSRGADAVVTDATRSAVQFGTGSILTTAGFATTNFDGMGGADTAVATAGARANVFEGWETRATLSNGSFTRNFANFSKVSVYGNTDEDAYSTLSAKLHDTARADAFAAFGDAATLDVDGANLYSVIAADQVEIKRDYRGVDDTLNVDTALDFALLADWEL